MAADAQWSQMGHGSLAVIQMGRLMFRSLAVAVLVFVALSLGGIL